MGKENFVIKESLVKEWELIGPTYEKKAGIILKPHHQNTYFGRMFGSKDSKTRFFQVALTKKMHEVLRDKLQPESFYSNNTVPMDHLSASKILIVTAFYIKHQIGLKYWVRSSSNSDLDEVLDNVIGLVGKNQLSKEKSADFFLTALRFIESSTLEGWNARLSQDTPKFTELEWRQFKDFVVAQSSYLRHYKPAYFPIASTTGYLLQQPCQIAGMSSGWLMGKMFSESSLGMPALVALSGGLCWIGGSVAGKGILLFAPKLAKQFLDNASGITMASLIGGIMGAVGYGVGYSAGLSLDLLCLAFQNACSYIVNIGSDNSPYEKLTGFTCDGKRILNGVEVQLIQKESAPSDMQPFTVEYTPHENGFLVKVGHDEVFIPKDFNQFAHKDFITKLLEKTAPQLAAPEPGLFDVEEDYETPIRAPEYHEDLFSQDTANTPLMGQPVPPPQTEQALVYEDVSFTEEEMALTEEDIPDHIRNLPKPYYLWALKEFLRSQSFLSNTWHKKPPQIEAPVSEEGLPNPRG